MLTIIVGQQVVGVVIRRSTAFGAALIVRGRHRYCYTPCQSAISTSMHARQAE